MNSACKDSELADAFENNVPRSGSAAFTLTDVSICVGFANIKTSSAWMELALAGDLERHANSEIFGEYQDCHVTESPRLAGTPGPPLAGLRVFGAFPLQIQAR